MIKKTIFVGMLLSFAAGAWADGLPAPDEVTLNVVEKKGAPTSNFKPSQDAPDEPTIRVSSAPAPRDPNVVAPPAAPPPPTVPRQSSPPPAIPSDPPRTRPCPRRVTR